MMFTSTADVLRRRAQQHPDRVAISFEGDVRTYAQLDHRSNRLAHALAAAGAGRGDRVAVLDRNRLEHAEIMFGAAKLGATYLPINWRLAADEVAYVLANSGASVVLVGTDFHDLLARTTTRPRIIDLDTEYGELLDDQPATDPGFAPAPTDTALQMYTSGTTGLPKGVLLSHAALCRAAALGAAWGMAEDTVALACMPLFHMSGTSWSFVCLFHGGHVVLLRDPDPVGILRAISTERVSHALLVPAVMQMLLAHSDAATADFSSLRRMVYGGSPISPDLLAEGIKTLGCDFMQLYGLTESTGLGTVLDPQDHLRDERLLRSVGKPAEGVELRIVDPTTATDAAVGEVGEVWLRSGSIMTGYWQDPAASDEVLLAEGWLRTGDAGYLDADGFVFLHDRVKDMIVSGGENVYPAEVERVLGEHPAVADVAVIGVPDDRWGETVKAVVVLAPGKEVDSSTLIDFTRERLAHYKCPTSVDFVADLPRNASGKVLKRQVREPYWEGHTRRVN
ncbi:MAG TPA: long-chain-fatty-acid--CoA ligase [Mycobacteriales bacterium]|nr:long-chain-fatty-acid--CoA ligase [Mycobacteriales bacterium]